MRNIKTAELEGVALDWAVAKATGAEQLKSNDWGSISCLFQLKNGDGCWTAYYRPSTEWEYGGPLIEKFCVEVWTQASQFAATVVGVPSPTAWHDPDGCGAFGPTHLVAACRAIVRRFIGETVDIPDELVTL